VLAELNKLIGLEHQAPLGPEFLHIAMRGISPPHHDRLLPIGYSIPIQVAAVLKGGIDPKELKITVAKDESYA